VLLADTAQIIPNPSTWTFSFTYNCGPGQINTGFTVQVAVTGGGGTEDISSEILSAIPSNPCAGGGQGGGGAAPPSYAVQFSSGTIPTKFQSDSQITINPTTHTLNVGPAPTYAFTFHPLGTMLANVNMDTTTAATALKSLGGGSASCNAFVTAATDISTPINNCNTALASNGGVIDATGYTGAQIASATNITLSPRVTLKIGCVKISGTSQITMGSYSAIEGSGGTGVYADEANAPNNSCSSWTYTGVSGDFIALQGGANNAYGVRLSNIRFLGPRTQSITATNGNGFHASPGNPVSYSNVKISFDHVTFTGFWQNGIRLEDNVYQVDCFGCGADQNGAEGWWQGVNVGTCAPNQIHLYSPYFNSNGILGSTYAQIYAGGGSGCSGELWIHGGTIANDLTPTKGVNTTCVNIQGNSIEVWLQAIHFEACGTSSGTGQFIEANNSGKVTISDDDFISPSSSYTPYFVNMDSSFAGILFLGPHDSSNYPATGSSTFPYIFNVNASTTAQVVVYDGITPSNLGGTIPANNDFAFLTSSPVVQSLGLTIGGPTWTTTAGIPSASCVNGSVDSNSAATSASTALYVCYNNAWTAVTVP
jgi:hypothetical protein